MIHKAGCGGRFLDSAGGLGQCPAAAGTAGETTLLRWLKDNALGTWLTTRLRGEAVGEDELGNRYYRSSRGRRGLPERRWVVYPVAAEIEPSRVAPGWNAWLHHNASKPPSEEPIQARRWERPHVPNLTGTADAYLPAGHERRGGRRAPATGDYEPWRPE